MLKCFTMPWQIECEITETDTEKTLQKSYGKRKKKKGGRRMLRCCKTLYKSAEFAVLHHIKYYLGR